MENGKGLQQFNQFITQDRTTDYLAQVLGSRKSTFIASVVSLMSNEKSLAQCTPVTVMYAALKATAYNFPLDNSLGFAYILPYNNKGTQEAQLQLGYKAFIQLAMRSGQFQTINVSDVRDGELKGVDRLSGEYTFEWNNEPSRNELQVIGYVGFFRLTNGFSKSIYMTKEELEAHGKRYSKSYNSKFSNWKNNFDSMASKTVIKRLLSKYAPLSLEMQDAIKIDQAVIRGEDEFEYVDNDNVNESKVEAIQEMFEEPTIVTVEQA